jgi:hypothetical protein
MGTLMN